MTDAAATAVAKAVTRKEKKDKKSKKEKKQKKKGVAAAGNKADGPEAASPAASAVPLPFDANPADHAESPLAAFQDLGAVLDFVAQHWRRKGGRRELKVFDPYFCTGKMRDHLAAVGCSEDNVVNEAVDFYSREALPECDLIVTNPPYAVESDGFDHVASLLDMVRRGGGQRVRGQASGVRDRGAHLTADKPLCLLVPSHYYMKSSMLSEAEGFVGCVVPSTRYSYAAPAWAEDAGGASRIAGTRSTSPFTSLWLVFWPGKTRAELVRPPLPTVRLARLPDKWKCSEDKTRHKTHR